MKRFLFTLACAIYSICGWAQKETKEIPGKVAERFSQRFQHVKQVEWVASSDENYEALFYQNGIKKTALFSNSGQWLLVKQEISVNEIPAKVSQSLSRDFPGYKVSQASRMELFGKGTSFRIRVRKGGGLFDVEIDVNGRIGKRVEVYEERDEHHHHDDCHHHCNHHHKHKNKHKHKHDKDHGHHDCEEEDDD